MCTRHVQCRKVIFVVWLVFLSQVLSSLIFLAVNCFYHRNLAQAVINLMHAHCPTVSYIYRHRLLLIWRVRIVPQYPWNIDSHDIVVWLLLDLDSSFTELQKTLVLMSVYLANSAKHGLACSCLHNDCIYILGSFLDRSTYILTVCIL